MRDRFLVAIVDATNSYVKFGLRMFASTQGNASVISVYYADDPPVSGNWDTPVSSWTVPSLVGRWTSIIVRAKGRHMSLYLDCHSQTPLDVQVTRLPRGLTFDTGSVVYVAQAGPQFAQHFEARPHISAALRVLYRVAQKFAHHFVRLNCTKY